ncbi:hypothetical protein [Hymenobacter sp. UYCo722]|uniref:hypothetical protein n=1 Tax=Hymenobacter sp. UYCo722 TaxID=3156335 RepID=UPI00339AB86E
MAHLLRLAALCALMGLQLPGPPGSVSRAPGPPEVSRTAVFRSIDDGARGEARFFSVVVSYPLVPGPGVAGAYVRLQVVQGLVPRPGSLANAARRVVLDLLVRRSGQQLRYWPELGSIALDGSMPCQAAETPLLDLRDTLHTARTGRYHNCYTRLETYLFAVTPLPGTTDTLYHYQLATVTSSTNWPEVGGLEVDQQLRLRGIWYRTTRGSRRRGFEDEWFFYHGQALLTPAHP